MREDMQKLVDARRGGEIRKPGGGECALIRMLVMEGVGGEEAGAVGEDCLDPGESDQGFHPEGS